MTTILGTDIEDVDNVEVTAQQNTPNGAPSAKEGRLNVRKVPGVRTLVFGLLPGLALILAIAAGYLKWIDGTVRYSNSAGTEAVRAASDSTVAILTYGADTVEHDLNAAQSQLTGTFKESYTNLTHDVVIPGAKQKHISAKAKIAAAAPVSADDSHAVVLVFVDQTVTVGTDAPSDTASTVRVTLDKTAGRWLISQFDPI